MLYLLGATILATIATTGVDAHGYIRNPRPRAWTIPGHRFEWDAQSDGGPFQDCWDRDANDPDPRNNKVGPIEATYIEGSEISVDVAISAGHAGWHELRFCPDLFSPSFFPSFFPLFLPSPDFIFLPSFVPSFT